MYLAVERNMDRGWSYLLLCLVFALLSSALHSSEAQPGQSLSDDRDALLLFKSSTDGGGVLDRTWHLATNPCQGWIGITCTANDERVKHVVVPGMLLNGTIPENSLGRLTELRMLNLSNNSFSGQFPGDFSNLRLNQFWAGNASISGPFPNISANSTKLTMLSLTGNNLTGSIPDLSSLQNLTMLDLSHNSFRGLFPSLPSIHNSILSTSNALKNSILFTTPPQNTRLNILNLSGNNFTDTVPDLSGLQNLTTLNLSHNFFQGKIPNLPPTLTALDLGSNSFNGTIPPTLAAKFPNAFVGDSGLCGPPTNNTCTPVGPSPAPGSNSGTPTPADKGSSNSSLSTRNAVLIAVGVLVLLLIFVTCYLYFAKRHKKTSTKSKPPKKGADQSGATAGLSSIGGDSDRSKLSFIDDSQQGYDLEDLLRASAEMLGKGSFGTAYKAVMESGMIVAVKRLRDVKDIRRNEFSQHMESLGRLKHPNVVPLRAYYYAREEKLLIYDFMPNGSLHALLHGNRGPARTPLEWPARVSIAQGVAQGLTYLHRECGQKIPHGNIKSSNVLMGKNFEVCISDFGLVPLMPATIAAQRMAGYRAPEFNSAKKITYKADVYSFGVLLLELLTGRQPAVSLSDNGLDLPKWVHSMVREEWTGEVFDPELKTYLHGEEEMVTLLQVAMSCVDTKPDQRPDMAAVMEQLDGIRRGESVIDSESFQSNSHSEDDHSSKDLPQSV